MPMGNKLVHARLSLIFAIKHCFKRLELIVSLTHSLCWFAVFLSMHVATLQLNTHSFYSCSASYLELTL